MKQLVVIGAGRMGTEVANLAAQSGEWELAAQVDVTTAGLLETLGRADAAIDFSAPGSLDAVAAYVRRTGTPLVSGTTGLSTQQMETLRALGEDAPVLYSANYSVGVAVLRRLAAEAARMLDGFDIEIVETHHNKKADAPSGTAKLLLAAVDPAGAYSPVYGREGMCGARTAREIGVHAVRGGTVAGEHTVAFFGDSEEIKLTHRADSRRIFAAGALRAAKELAAREPGFYTFEEILFTQEEH